MTKKVVSFSGKIGVIAPGERLTHFFLNRALLRLNPALTLLPAFFLLLKSRHYVRRYRVRRNRR